MKLRTRFIVSMAITALAMTLIEEDSSVRIILSGTVGLTAYFLMRESGNSLLPPEDEQAIIKKQIIPSPGTEYLLVADKASLRSLTRTPITIVDDGQKCFVVMSRKEDPRKLSLFMTAPEESSALEKEWFETISKPKSQTKDSKRDSVQLEGRDPENGNW